MVHGRAGRLANPAMGSQPMPFPALNLPRIRLLGILLTFYFIRLLQHCPGISGAARMTGTLARVSFPALQRASGVRPQNAVSFRETAPSSR